MLDVFGDGYVLLCFDALDRDDERLQGVAQRLGMPLTLQPLADESVAALYARRRVLVRPDGHVAWRGERLPDDLASLLDQVRGVAAAGARA